MTLNTVWNSLYHTSSRQVGGREGNRISVMEIEWMQSKQILGCPKLANTSGSHMGSNIFHELQVQKVLHHHLDDCTIRQKTVWSSLYHTSSRQWQGGGREGNRISVMEIEWMQLKKILGCPKFANTSGSHMGSDIFRMRYFLNKPPCKMF